MNDLYVEPNSKCENASKHYWCYGWLGELIIYCKHCDKETLGKPEIVNNEE